MKRLLSVALMFTVLIGSIFSMPCASIDESTAEDAKEEKEKIIRWVDFDVCAAALREGAALDIDSHASEAPLSWVDLLAYYAMRHGGSFQAIKQVICKKLPTPHTVKENQYINSAKAAHKQNYFDIIAPPTAPYWTECSVPTSVFLQKQTANNSVKQNTAFALFSQLRKAIP